MTAHEAFVDVLAAGGLGKLRPLFAGPDSSAPDAVLPYPAAEAVRTSSPHRRRDRHHTTV